MRVDIIIISVNLYQGVINRHNSPLTSHNDIRCILPLTSTPSHVILSIESYSGNFENVKKEER